MPIVVGHDPVMSMGALANQMLMQRQWNQQQGVDMRALEWNGQQEANAQALDERTRESMVNEDQRQQQIDQQRQQSQYARGGGNYSADGSQPLDPTKQAAMRTLDAAYKGGTIGDRDYIAGKLSILGGKLPADQSIAEARLQQGQDRLDAESDRTAAIGAGKDSQALAREVQQERAAALDRVKQAEALVKSKVPYTPEWNAAQAALQGEYTNLLGANDRVKARHAASSTGAGSVNPAPGSPAPTAQAATPGNGSGQSAASAALRPTPRATAVQYIQKSQGNAQVARKLMSADGFDPDNIQ